MRWVLEWAREEGLEWRGKKESSLKGLIGLGLPIGKISCYALSKPGRMETGVGATRCGDLALEG